MCLHEQIQIVASVACSSDGRLSDFYSRLFSTRNIAIITIIVDNDNTTMSRYILISNTTYNMA